MNIEKNKFHPAYMVFICKDLNIEHSSILHFISARSGRIAYRENLEYKLAYYTRVAHVCYVQIHKKTSLHY